MRLGDKKYLNLWREMTRAQFKLRDQSSFFGFLWSFLNPLITVGLLFALFSTRLSNEIQDYALYMLIGIVYYTHFSNATGASTNILYSMNALTRNGVFPKDILVAASISTHSVDLILSTLVCVLITFFYGTPITFAVLALPLVILVQIMLVLWVSLLLSSFYVFVRDLVHIYNVFLRLLFFLTPIFYGLSFVGALGRFVLLANPLSHTIIFARDILIKGQLFDFRDFSLFFAINAGMLYASYKIFKRLEPSFAESI